NWETAIASELPRYVDAHYRTIRNRRGRALVGLSAGGYGAVVLALNHLADFSVVESWSGYFRPTDPSGTAVIPHTPSQSAHVLVARLRADEWRRPTFFAFYVGSEDRRFRAENEQLDRELRAAGVPHVFTIYPGAHEQSAGRRMHNGGWDSHSRGPSARRWSTSRGATTRGAATRSSGALPRARRRPLGRRALAHHSLAGRPGPGGTLRRRLRRRRHRVAPSDPLRNARSL